MADHEKTCQAVKANVDTYLAAAKAALKSKNIDEYETAKVDLEKTVKELTKVTRELAYEQFMKAENPLMAALEQFYVTSYRVKEEKGKEGEDEGKTIGLSVAANEKQRIDFDDFCDYASLDREWLHDCAKLLVLLQIRKTDIYNMTASELKQYSENFKSAVRAKKAGETPDSNTKIVALLQRIVDETIFVDNGNGKNKHKCTCRDIVFIEDCAHQFNPKAKAGIKSLSVRVFQTVMSSVLYSILTGEGYTVKNYKVKDAD